MDERQLPNATVSLWPAWFFPGTRSVIERKRKIRRYDPVDFTKEPPKDAAEIALLARLRALQESVIRFSAWDRREVGELIKGARDAVVVAHDPKVGAELLSRAQETYYLGLQTRNRLSYALWSVVGTVGSFFLWRCAGDFRNWHLVARKFTSPTGIRRSRSLDLRRLVASLARLHG